MIDYGKFRFATPPRTGSTWFMKVSAELGLPEGFKAHVHNPFEGDNKSKLDVSIVRHPFEWLISYYYAIGGGNVGVPCVDVFSKLGGDTPHEFICNYLNTCPGAISKMFNTYRADTCLRLVEIKWASYELFTAIGIGATKVRKAVSMNKQNATKSKTVFTFPSLRQKVYEAEKDFYLQYDYCP